MGDPPHEAQAGVVGAGSPQTPCPDDGRFYCPQCHDLPTRSVKLVVKFAE